MNAVALQHLYEGLTLRQSEEREVTFKRERDAPEETAEQPYDHAARKA